MTSLMETLPILDEAVPALPVKVGDVARKGDEYHGVAQEALATFRQKRAQVDSLMEQVRQALEALRDHATEEQHRVEAAGRTLHQAAEEEAHAVDEAVGHLDGEGQEAVTAFGALESHLVQAGERSRTAQDEARAALDALGEEARTSQPEIDAAVDGMTASVASAQHAVAEGQKLVTEGLSSLKEAMRKLLADAQGRLDQTYQRLDALAAAQEKVVGEASSALSNHRQELEHKLEQRLDSELEQALSGELEAVQGALGEMGQQAMGLQSETETHREQLVAQLTEVGGRVPTLQGGAENVKQAAVEIGIAWP